MCKIALVLASLLLSAAEINVGEEERILSEIMKEFHLFMTPHFDRLLAGGWADSEKRESREESPDWLEQLHAKFPNKERLIGVAAIRFFTIEAKMEWYLIPYAVHGIAHSFTRFGLSDDEAMNLLIQQTYPTAEARIIAQTLLRMLAEDATLEEALARLDALETLESDAAAFLLDSLLTSRHAKQTVVAMIKRTSTEQAVLEEFSLDALDELWEEEDALLRKMQCSDNTWVRLYGLSRLFGVFDQVRGDPEPCLLEREDLHPLETYWLELMRLQTAGEFDQRVLFLRGEGIWPRRE